MTQPSSSDSEQSQKFIEALQNDFRILSNESKKKYPQLKESCEEAIVVLKNSAANKQSLYYIVNQILYPVVQGCETKDLKIIKFCLGLMQRLITRQVIDQKGARYIIDALWRLMETETEEVKVLQTVILLLTTNNVVQGETLSKAMVVCFRLHFTKDSTTINTAGATVRQLVTLVFDRMISDDKTSALPEDRPIDLEQLKTAKGAPPKGLFQSAVDAFLLFQDLVQLVDADQPYWLLGMTEMTRTFGLELLETVLMQFSSIFFKYPEFAFLLKERVCALVIKLFSPHIKYRNNIPPNLQQLGTIDKPYFPISMRLLRVVSILIQKYHQLLVTECEIFLSLIVKFLDNDKPAWQRSLALEVLHKIILQPNLLVAFVECYDIKDHATNIFQDIVNSLGAYVQGCFTHIQQTTPYVTGVMASNINGAPLGYSTGVSSQPGFSYRGIWIPLTQSFNEGQSKPVYLEMLDKMEPPQIPEGYGISVAYACILDLVRSISIIIQGNTLPPEAETIRKNITSDEQKALFIQLINSSFFGLLAGLYLMCDAATDESLTDSCLKQMQIFTALCGILDLRTPRDAFVVAFCRASLPPHYAHTILNMNYQEFGFKNDNHDIVTQYTGPCIENDFRHQVVAVGTPLPTLSIPVGAQLGPVMLTAKNLQCMRALLHLSLCHGQVLGTSWHTILVTLQHLAWILGLKPQTGGSLQVQPKTTSDTNSITHVMSELPILSTMLSQLFEASQHLDETSLHYLIDALCQMSQEAMELAYSNREPSLFAVAKLLETGLVNLFRVEVYWKPLTNHLLEVSSHPHIRMREWGVEAITYLVKSALQYKYEKNLKDNAKLQILLLGPLAELSSLPHGDVRQKQLECVLQILNGSGEIQTHGWPLVLNIIGAVSDHHGETLIRIAFQCLQLVITDFLPAMPWRCLPLSINTAAKFGSKAQELNISLTAVGLMWNISDYFNQNQDKLSQPPPEDAGVLPDFSGVPNMAYFDKLWMCLYSRLGELCVDGRPAVRKSATQTLFSKISAHGGLLHNSTWQVLLWQVLFPLLDKVRQQASQASSAKVDTSGNILIHHSRNTAQKQWAETQVLTLSGVSKLFNTKRQILQNTGNFNGAWRFLLDVIEFSALSKNNEVSLAALKSFQELLYNNATDDQNVNNTGTTETIETWTVAWKFWLNIGTESTKPQVYQNIAEKSEDNYIPNQAFLTALVQIFPALFQHIKTIFSETDLKQLCAVLTNTISIPVHNDSTPYIISTVSDSLLTPLHEGVLNCIEFLQREVLSNTKKLGDMIIILLRQLMLFSRYSCDPPVLSGVAKTQDGNELNEKSVGTNTCDIEWVNMNYIPFGEKAMTMLVKLYQETADLEIVIKNDILHEMIKTFRISLSLKYKCMSSSTWKLAITSLMSTLDSGLKVARKYPNDFTNMWTVLAETLDEFLFPKSVCSAEDRGLDELVLDEAIDCQVIELIRDKILPFSAEIPQQFILDIVVLLNKGSIHSLNCTQMGFETELKLRESFAKICFETLLQFSLVSELKNSENNNMLTLKSKDGCVAGRLAITALLHRFEEILKKYNEDERNSGKCPLARFRTSEVSFVLKSIATLVTSLKKVPTDKVGKTAWDQLISLYPYLVDCTTTSSHEVSRSLREALLPFSDLIKPPTVSNKNNTSD